MYIEEAAKKPPKGPTKCAKCRKDMKPGSFTCENCGAVEWGVLVFADLFSCGIMAFAICVVVRLLNEGEIGAAVFAGGLFGLFAIPLSVVAILETWKAFFSRKRRTELFRRGPPPRFPS